MSKIKNKKKGLISLIIVLVIALIILIALCLLFIGKHSGDDDKTESKNKKFTYNVYGDIEFCKGINCQVPEYQDFYEIVLKTNIKEVKDFADKVNKKGHDFYDKYKNYGNNDAECSDKKIMNRYSFKPYYNVYENEEYYIMAYRDTTFDFCSSTGGSTQFQSIVYDKTAKKVVPYEEFLSREGITQEVLVSGMLKAVDFYNEVSNGTLVYSDELLKDVHIYRADGYALVISFFNPLINDYSVSDFEY